MNKDILNAILRTDFKSFVEKVFNEVSPSALYMDNWHIDLICSELMSVENGDHNRLIINLPPRYMKSIICSVAFPAFILGHNPKASLVCVSYNDSLSEKLALDCKKVIESEWYKELFPQTKLSKNKKAVLDFETTDGGGRFSTSVNGTLTGRGGDYLIIDDPIKPTDANSDLQRNKVNEWYGNTLYSRLNNKNTCKIIVVMQRIHEEDLTGYLLDSDENFKLIKIQAIAEQDEKWMIRTKYGDKIIERSKGEALHPDWENIHRLGSVKEYMGEYNFAGQYQQNPAPKDGGIIKRKWFKKYDKEELIKSINDGSITITGVIQSWDTACKIEQHNDYSVCITALKDINDRTFIFSVYRKKLEFPDLIKQIIAMHNQAKERFKKNVKILIEDKASGTQIIQTLKKDYCIVPEAIKPEYDKQSRLMGVSHLIENGKCLFPKKEESWWMDFENELLRFPKVKHDDQCDALSQLLNYNHHVCIYDALYTNNEYLLSNLLSRTRFR